MIIRIKQFLISNKKIFLISTILVSINVFGAKVKKKISFNSYTLNDNYKYRNKDRCFQWDKISSIIDSIEIFENRNVSFGILKNYKNKNGYPPLTFIYTINKHNSFADIHNRPRHQGIPLYPLEDNSSKIKLKAERYSLDGSLVGLIAEWGDFYIIEHAHIKGLWRVPKQYFSPIEVVKFNKIIFIDNTNQNITTLENVNSVWHIKSMNPATTGLYKPPHNNKTPIGIFVFQNIKYRMYFVKDGTDELAGHAPYASRFCGGAYIHGIPTNLPDTIPIEYSRTLGTIPLSHMCVRNATSHAKFIYNWGEENETLIITIK